MGKKSIFSYTPNKYSNNSSVLHRRDVAEADVKLVTEELEVQGHRIVGVLPQRNDDQARQRRGRR